MKRVLCIVSAMNAGGAETFLMKIYRCLDRTRYQMDFCVNVRDEGLYDAEIRSMGGRIFHIPSKSENLKEFTRQLYSVVKDNGYQNVMRITSNAMGFYDLHVAKKAGAANCIARSSNSGDGGGIKSKIAHLAGKILYKRAVDVEIAPSDLAAIYTFGKRDYRSGKVVILRNGIDLEEYRFSDEARENIRSEFGISDDAFVVGHIGRFSPQKNHGFLLEVFSELAKTDEGAVLLLVGSGELEDDVKKRVSDLRLDGRVIFAGVRRDVPAILSAMDVFLLPSLYEGMPNVIIEAQANGLPCLVSDSITNEVKITGLVDAVSIDDANAWISSVRRYIDFWKAPKIVRTDQKLHEEYDINAVCRSFASILI